jgi:hypothetical protein
VLGPRAQGPDHDRVQYRMGEEAVKTARCHSGLSVTLCPRAQRTSEPDSPQRERRACAGLSKHCDGTASKFTARRSSCAHARGGRWSPPYVDRLASGWRTPQFLYTPKQSGRATPPPQRGVVRAVEGRPACPERCDGGPARRSVSSVTSAGGVRLRTPGQAAYAFPASVAVLRNKTVT